MAQRGRAGGRNADVERQGHAPGGQHLAAPGQRVPALRVRPLGSAMAEDASPRRHDRRAVRGGLHRRVSVPGGGRAVPDRAPRAVGEVRPGAAPREDAAAGVRAIRGRAPTARRRGEAGDVRLPRLHAHLREEAERAVHGGPANDPEEAAGEAERGESRVAATPARADPRSGGVAASGHHRAPEVLRGANEQAGAVHVLFAGRVALVPRPEAAQPDCPAHLGADAAAHSALAPTSAHHSPVSLEATWRCHLRQEPDAVMPHVRICGGGYGQPSSLLRLLLEPRPEIVALTANIRQFLAFICGDAAHGVAARAGGYYTFANARTGNVPSPFALTGTAKKRLPRSGFVSRLTS